MLMYPALSGQLAAHMKYDLSSFQSLLSVRSHHHIFTSTIYNTLWRILDKLLKHAAWNGLISHFTGLHPKKLVSVFSKCCTSTLTHLDTFQNKAACIPALQMAGRTHLCLPALDHSILRHISHVLASVARLHLSPQSMPFSLYCFLPTEVQFL